jgi:tripartite ATP-independent transporter DctM subunit
MSSIATGALPKAELGASSPRWRVAHHLENLLLTLALGVLVLLPLAEAVLRKLIQTGIPSSSALTQHLTLLVTMLGAAVAARDGKLLSLFELASLAGSAARPLCRAISHVGAAVVAALLAVASAKLVQSEHAAGTTLAIVIPVWLLQCVMPAGFAALAGRLLLRAADAAAWRASAIAVFVVLIACVSMWGDRAEMLWPAAAALLGATALCGAPIFAILGGAGLLLFWSSGDPTATVALEHYRMVVNPALPAIPLFTVAGFALAAGRAPQRLNRLFQALFGHLRGGVAVASVVVGAFFTALTGGSGVTILALGGVLFPLLVTARYRQRDALGLVTVSGSLGTLLPPCLPLVLYAIVARIEISRMFLGAALPAMLMITAVAVWGARRDPRPAGSLRRFSARRACQAACLAKWELGLPLVVCLSLFGGFATPVEAAALTALYVVAVERFAHGSLRQWKLFVAVMSDCGALVGGVLLILGVALGLTNYLVGIQWPDHAAEWALQSIHSRWLFLLVLNALLLLAGCLMEIWAAIVVLPPLLVPVGLAFGLDPVHLGVIFLANLELGLLTPLVGVNLFYASARFDKPILEICRTVLPLYHVLVLCVLAITYLPGLSTLLPAALR